MDVVTYALCKKLISRASTGIQKIEVDKNGDLIFTMADESIIKIDMPIKPDCVDVTFVDSLPISGIEENKIYIVKTALKDDEGNSIFRQYVWINNEWKFIGISGQPIASQTQLGLVKPDGKTVKITSDGIISVNIDYVHEKIDELIVTNEQFTDKGDVDLFDWT